MGRTCPPAQFPIRKLFTWSARASPPFVITAFKYRGRVAGQICIQRRHFCADRAARGQICKWFCGVMQGLRSDIESEITLDPLGASPQTPGIFSLRVMGFCIRDLSDDDLGRAGNFGLATITAVLICWRGTGRDADGRRR